MPTQVLVPPLGQTVDTLNFVAWLKQEGEHVQQGEGLYVVETDKAMLDVESPATGRLAQVTAKKGDEVKVLSAIAVILQDDEAMRWLKRPLHPSRTRQPFRNPPRDRLRSLRSPASGELEGSLRRRGRRLADAERVPLEQLDPTGPEGAIVERDVQAFLTEREVARTQAASVAASAS